MQTYHANDTMPGFIWAYGDAIVIPTPDAYAMHYYLRTIDAPEYARGLVYRYLMIPHFNMLDTIPLPSAWLPTLGCRSNEHDDDTTTS
jgi:hypothetical protein